VFERRWMMVQDQRENEGEDHGSVQDEVNPKSDRSFGYKFLLGLSMFPEMIS